MLFRSEAKKKKYPKADQTSKQLASIMKTMLVKRIDSSFFAFKKSLHRYHQANQVMLNMFEKGVIYIAPNLKVNELLSAGKEEELIRLIEESKESRTMCAISTHCPRRSSPGRRPHPSGGGQGTACFYEVYDPYAQGAP